jgi:hypothetical protein
MLIGHEEKSLGYREYHLKRDESRDVFWDKRNEGGATCRIQVRPDGWAALPSRNVAGADHFSLIWE